MNCPKDAISMGLLNGFRVNGAYKFDKLLADDSVSGNFVNDKTIGYYKKFNKYYNKIDEELIALGLTPPRSLFEPDKYAIMSKKEKKAYKKAQAQKQK